MKEVLKIKSCRICKSSDLLEVINLGSQALTGVFPKSSEDHVLSGPLEVVWCKQCDLLQLNHRYPPEEMYGDNYGYRSGLNQSMIDHLSWKACHLSALVGLKGGNSVLDIGSNDGTLLNAYQQKGISRVGIDPTAKKFEEYYHKDIEVIPDFFSSSILNGKKFDIITSISMFYDLDDPVAFVNEVKQSLSPSGIWHFEQSYMPSMIRQNSYDTICHEHIEYYSLSPIEKILNKANLRIIDVKMNNINGGSFAVTACHKNSFANYSCDILNWLLNRELKSGYSTPTPYREFENRMYEHRDSLRDLILNLNQKGKTIHLYGASTKGNVLLQFCGFTSHHIPFAAEVNPSKFGRVTPGSNIPIISSEESMRMKPDYYLVMPWHFREGIIKNEKEYLSSGGRLIFPLPEIEIL